MRRRAASLVGSRLGGLQAEAPQASGLTTASAPSLFGITGSRVSKASAARAGGAVVQARGAAAAAPAAAAVATRLQPNVLPLTRVDEFGAISILEGQEAADFVPKVYENVDGRRIEDGRYAAFTKDLLGGWVWVGVCITVCMCVRVHVHTCVLGQGLMGRSKKAAKMGCPKDPSFLRGPGGLLGPRKVGQKN